MAVGAVTPSRTWPKSRSPMRTQAGSRWPAAQAAETRPGIWLVEPLADSTHCGQHSRLAPSQASQCSKSRQLYTDPSAVPSRGYGFKFLSPTAPYSSLSYSCFSFLSLTAPYTGCYSCFWVSTCFMGFLPFSWGFYIFNTFFHGVSTFTEDRTDRTATEL